MAAGRTAIVVCLAIIAGIGLAVAKWTTSRSHGPTALVLDGNVDVRQAELAFNNSERIAEVLAQEGDRVHRGQLLARLETVRLLPIVAQAQAQVDAQHAAVDRLRRGNRPEEIAQARANAALASADAANARIQFKRLSELSRSSAGRGISKQDLDNAHTALDAANARLEVGRNTLALQVEGPRKEDIAQAEAQLNADSAHFALLKQELADADLVSPVDGVVRARLLERGEMASPQRPVFTIAITDPKWVRAYVDESRLGEAHTGEAATIAVDSLPGRQFDGWVGFVSPVAEFTPKSVQTQDLRTSLVYEVRVFVNDPKDELPLGTPATVTLAAAHSGAE